MAVDEHDVVQAADAVEVPSCGIRRREAECRRLPRASVDELHGPARIGDVEIGAPARRGNGDDGGRRDRVGERDREGRPEGAVAQTEEPEERVRPLDRDQIGDRVVVQARGCDRDRRKAGERLHLEQRTGRAPRPGVIDGVQCDAAPRRRAGADSQTCARLFDHCGKCGGRTRARDPAPAEHGKALAPDLQAEDPLGPRRTQRACGSAQVVDRDDDRERRDASPGRGRRNRSGPAHRLRDRRERTYRKLGRATAHPNREETEALVRPRRELHAQLNCGRGCRAVREEDGGRDERSGDRDGYPRGVQSDRPRGYPVGSGGVPERSNGAVCDLRRRDHARRQHSTPASRAWLHPVAISSPSCSNT